VATVGKGSIQTKQGFGDCQLHLEFREPVPATGKGQGRGNSGVFLMERYEIQVLDSYEDGTDGPLTYPDGQCGALYKQHCGSCHRAHGVGVAVGPELSGEAKQPEETLLKSILAPSSQITAGYATYTVLTNDGQVFTGLLGADTASSVTLKQQEGKTQTVLRKEIDEIKASPASLMPESLTLTLSPQDVADILAWLRDPAFP
jgi:putative heme-binding domain-containing protein